MNKDRLHDIIQIQSQLNYFKFSSGNGFGAFVQMLRQFARQSTGDLRALIAGPAFAHLLDQPHPFWHHTFQQCPTLRFYVYVRDAAEAPDYNTLADSPLAQLSAKVEVCSFVTTELECCLFFTEKHLLALQDAGERHVGFAFPREWGFIHDYITMIEQFVALAKPVMHYSNRTLRPPLPAIPPRN